MYVIPSRKLLYLAQPKTGSTSIGSYIRDEMRGQMVHVDVTPASREKLHHWAPHHAADPDDVERYKREGYTAFTFVRNPWDYAVSWYHHRKGNRDPFPPFKEFLRSDEKGYGFLDQYNKDPNGNTGRIFWNLPFLADRVYQFENLNHSLADAFGMPGFELTRHAKKSDGREHYSKYYDEEDMEYIYRLACRDILDYGYEYVREP